jgi:hypothetical protein
VDCSHDQDVINCPSQLCLLVVGDSKVIAKLLRMLGLAKGRDDAPALPVQAVTYKGYTIVPTPRKAKAGWTTEGNISKEIDGVTRSDHFIRADTCSERDQAVSHSILKAKRIIDERGDALFAKQSADRS